jgi:hypothetical protein
MYIPLIEHGHRQIAFITRPNTYVTRVAQLGRDPRGGLLLWADQNMPFSEGNPRALRDTIVEHEKYLLVRKSQDRNFP